MPAMQQTAANHGHPAAPARPATAPVAVAGASWRQRPAAAGCSWRQRRRGTKWQCKEEREEREKPLPISKLSLPSYFFDE